MTSLPRPLLALLLGALLWMPRGAVAQSPEDRANMSEGEVCPLERIERPPEPSTEQERHAYRSMRTAAADARRRCVLALRAERDKLRRAAHARPRWGLTLGYDGSLLFRWHESGLYRAPSVQLGALFRRNYRPIVGLHVLLAVGLGSGNFGVESTWAVPDFASSPVGPSLGAVSEVGLLLGPGIGTRVYGLVTSQLRLAVPGTTKKTFELDADTGEDRLTVEWPRPTTCLGIRGGVGMMFGKLHQGFIEAGGGGRCVAVPVGRRVHHADREGGLAVRILTSSPPFGRPASQHPSPARSPPSSRACAPPCRDPSGEVQEDDRIRPGADVSGYPLDDPVGSGAQGVLQAGAFRRRPLDPTRLPDDRVQAEHRQPEPRSDGGSKRGLADPGVPCDVNAWQCPSSRVVEVIQADASHQFITGMDARF